VPEGKWGSITQINITPTPLTPHTQIRRDLVVQRSWKGLLERMKTGLVVGCLQVDAKPLKAQLVPVIQVGCSIMLLQVGLRFATSEAVQPLDGVIAVSSPFEPSH